MPTITHRTTAIHPPLILGWREETESRNVVHDIIDRTEPDITLRASTMRSGTLRLFFEDEPSSVQAAALHRLVGTFTLTDPDRFSFGMHYVVDGRVSRELDPQTLVRWVVSVDYRETKQFAVPYPDTFYPDTVYPA